MVLVYFASYVTRLNYGVVLVGIMDALDFSKAAVAVPLTCMSVTYGIGQLISGYIGDRKQPRTVVGCGLFLTVLMNLMMPLCVSTWQMAILWSINGFAQALIWPPLVRLMSALYDAEGYTRASTWVTCGGLFGNICIYLAASFLLRFGTWKSTFLFSAIVGVLTLLVWLIKCPQIEMPQQNVKSGSAKPTRFPWSVMLCVIMLIIILQGMLRDGIRRGHRPCSPKPSLLKTICPY